jgi:hypothetical protein
LSNLGQGKVSILIEAVNQTRNAIQGAESDLERLRRARLDNARIVLEEQRTQRFLTQAYRAQHQQFMDTISVMRTVGSIGRGVLTMWQAYTIGQIHVQESLKNVEEAQIAVNTALELYGENSVVYQDAVSNLEDLEAAADKAKGNETAGLLGLGLTAVGVAAQIGTLAQKLELIDELALAGGIVIPIAIALGIRNALKDTDYWEEGDPNLPPGPGNAPGFRLDKWWQDMTTPSGAAGGGLGGGGAGARGGIQITQINYGVEGAMESILALQNMLNDLIPEE